MVRTYRCTELVERMQCRQRHHRANVHEDSTAVCVRPYSFFQLLKYSTMDYRGKRKVTIEFSIYINVYCFVLHWNVCACVCGFVDVHVEVDEKLCFS